MPLKPCSAWHTQMYLHVCTHMRTYHKQCHTYHKQCHTRHKQCHTHTHHKHHVTLNTHHTRVRAHTHTLTTNTMSHYTHTTHACARAHTHTHAHTRTHSVQRAGIDRSQVFKELPVAIRNSRLDAALLCELESQTSTPEKMDFLGLSS